MPDSGLQRLLAQFAGSCRFVYNKALALQKERYAAGEKKEDLAVKNMSRSAKGTKQKPGRNVKAKSGLNKAILDQGWREFRRQLEYKLAWAGGLLVVVPAHHTSQTCPECGYVSKENRKTQAVFRCMCCGHKANADLVGAINILRAGHAQLACGEESSGAIGCKTNCVKLPSVKQEPTEASQETVGIPVL